MKLWPPGKSDPNGYFTARHERAGTSTAQKGFALVTVIIAGSLVLLTLLVAVTFTELSAKLLTVQLSYQGQALNVANAGLVDGLGWFLRQTPQPVKNFTPKRNLTATPPIDDTDTETTPPSIRRDFQISAPGNVWGHYEMVAGSMVPGSKTVASGVFDLTPARRGNLAAPGMVWQLQSTGVVYVRNTPDMTVPYDQPPNRVLSRRLLRSEIARFLIKAPGAALSIQSCSNATVGTSGNSNARILGGSSGVGIGCVSGTPVVQSGATLSGTSSSSTGLNTGDFALANVFGVSTLADLAEIADINVNSPSALPASLPPMQLVVINAGAGVPVSFGPANPLQGSGILVVAGDLTLSGNSSWNGIVYVMGNVTIIQPANVYGTVVVANAGGKATVMGSGNWAEVYYDPFILTQLTQQIGQYRFSRSAYIPCPDPVNDPLCRKRLSGNREIGF